MHTVQEHHVHECEGACTHCQLTLSDGRSVRTCNSGMNWERMREKDLQEGLGSDISEEVVRRYRAKERDKMNNALKNI